MIGQYLPYSDAQKVTSKNRERIYASTGSGQSGFERASFKPFPDIHTKPKFRISKSAKFFTIGSCFARHIEAVLSESAVDCLTKNCVFPDDLYELTGIGARNGALNAYTPHSMLELLRINDRTDASTAGLLQVGNDTWADMMVSGLRFLGNEEVQNVRQAILKLYSSVSQADVFVITLGYTESWFDTSDRLFVNRSPGASLKTARLGDRYSFFNADAGAVESAIVNIVKTIQERTSGKALVVVTVSPVPLHATFTDMDSICANQYSKSTLLSAAVKVANRFDFVDYFPSFELVMNSDRSWVWNSDGVHVNPEVVRRVMDTFRSAYFVN